jgi:rfaE bifunctional protein kinase chain/domain
MLTTSELNRILEALPDQTIGLVGDLFLDRYLEIAADLHELSIETGLEAFQVECIRNCPGALGTIINNLAALGVGRILPLSVIGDDGLGLDLSRALQQVPGLQQDHVLRCASRATPTYIKPLQPTASGQWQELNRMDVRSREPLSPAVTDAVCEHLQRLFQQVDGLIVLDQVPEADWGVVNSTVRECLAELSYRHSAKLVYIDSRSQLRHFHFGILKGNRHELAEATGVDADDERAIGQAAVQLSQRTGQPVFCTLGELGMLVARPSARPERVAAYRVDGPIDIVGAGDSATAGLVTALVAGADSLTAAAVANLVASITVQQLGTTGSASPDQVRRRWQACQSPH